MDGAILGRTNIIQLHVASQLAIFLCMHAWPMFIQIQSHDQSMCMYAQACMHMATIPDPLLSNCGEGHQFLLPPLQYAFFVLHADCTDMHFIVYAWETEYKRHYSYRKCIFGAGMAQCQGFIWRGRRGGRAREASLPHGSTSPHKHYTIIIQLLPLKLYTVFHIMQKVQNVYASLSLPTHCSASPTSKNSQMIEMLNGQCPPPPPPPHDFSVGGGGEGGGCEGVGCEGV